MRFLPTLLLSALALASVAAPAFAQAVRRCESLDGRPVYTDKRCEDIGAIDALPRPSAPPAGNTGGSMLGRGCSRTLSDLVYRVTSAIDNHDVNKLAGVYQWAGVSDAAASRILDRLEVIVDRPLLDIVPIRPVPPPLTDDAGNVIDANVDGYYPQTVAPQRPTGLKVMQTTRRGVGAGTASTSFGLRRSYGCFWISL